jgi:hypothetical protein
MFKLRSTYFYEVQPCFGAKVIDPPAKNFIADQLTIAGATTFKI